MRYLLYLATQNPFEQHVFTVRLSAAEAKLVDTLFLRAYEADKNLHSWKLLIMNDIPDITRKDTIALLSSFDF